jgi:hypothetical protein
VRELASYPASSGHSIVEILWERARRIELKAPLLVGFFLAGLVIHGGLQGWWIAPVLASLSETPLFLSSVLGWASG